MVKVASVGSPLYFMSSSRTSFSTKNGPTPTVSIQYFMVASKSVGK